MRILSFLGNCEFIEVIEDIFGIFAFYNILWEVFCFLGNCWVYWGGATVLIARGLLLSSSFGPGSFAFHKVIYSRLQPFTASPLEMTLWNRKAALPRAAAKIICWQTDEVFLPQFFSVGIFQKILFYVLYQVIHWFKEVPNNFQKNEYK